MRRLVRALIAWMVRRADWWNCHPLTQWSRADKKHRTVAFRYVPFWPDEIQRGDNTIYLQLPWYRPFNILLHHWRAHDDGQEMHDHPRWSITICLKGEIVEKTPWGERTLKPGSVVFRSTRYIHGFRVAPAHSCRTWTLFIVGPRARCQNTYFVERRMQTPIRGKAA